MRKFLFFCLLLGLVFQTYAKPKEKKQKEITYEEVTSAFFPTKLQKKEKYFVIKNVMGKKEFGYSFGGIEVEKDSPFIVETPDFFERLEPSRQYTIYIRAKKIGQYKYSAVLLNMEGLRTIEEVKIAEAEAEAKRIAEEKAAEDARIAAEEAEKQKKAEAIKAKNEKAIAFAKGYTYHGIEEANANAQLFDSGALETGHAYYISTYQPYGNDMGGVFLNLFAKPKYVLVDYASQKVKGEVINASRSIFGNMPVAVVVAGGKAPVYMPIILGLVE